MDDHIEKPTSDLIFSWPNYPESMLKLLQNSKMTNPCKNAFAGPERVNSVKSNSGNFPTKAI